MKTLLDIKNDLLAVLDAVQDGGEIDAEFDAWMVTLAEQEADKLDGYVSLIKTLEGEINTANDVAERMYAKVRQRENKIKFMRKRMTEHLEATGRKRIQTASGWTVRLHANKQGISLTGEVPEAFNITETVTTTKPNWKAIEAAMKTDGWLPFAVLEERTNHLRIE
jgi:Siphovirus Gp157